MVKKMIFRSMFLALAIVFSSLLFLGTTVSAEQVIVNKPILHGDFDFNSNELTSVIIELKEQSMVEAKHSGTFQTTQNLQAKRNQVVAEIMKQTEVNVLREYEHIFSGIALEIPSNKILGLLSIPGIKAVYPNVHYTQEVEMTLADEFSPDMTSSNPYVGAPEAWRMGYTGRGITVAVIDTGVDYTHPELQHAFGEYKGYDFVDNDSDPQEGLEQYHGTHVSGTIAAWSFGIAPEVRLLAYRVLGPNGGSSDNVIAAIEQAVLDGADVMNLSLGNSLNDPDYATSIALDWAMAEGVVAVTSNGNSGPNNWTVGSPGASREAISVGSTALPYVDYHVLQFNTPTNGTNYPTLKVMGTDSLDSMAALNGNTYEYIFAGLGTKAQLANMDLTGKIALIQRGSIAFVEKVQNAKDRGAVAVIIFNNALGEINTSGDFSLPTFQLDYYDGVAMYFEEDKNVQITVEFNEIGETMSDFSSRGPAFSTWMIKPDVSAPGDWILSTYPGGYYAYAGGTSMASPHVAGAAALILQAHPDYSPEDVKAALMNTADLVIDPLTGKPYPHNTQGAGSIRIVDAINATTLVTPGSHSFGKFVKNTGKQVKMQSIEIKNLSDEFKEYTFDVQFNGNPQGIKVMTSNNTKVRANSVQHVQFNVQVDTSILAPGYYEGTITITNGTETILVPTILFVQEPDYPRVSSAGVQDNGDGTYLAYGYLPAGAEYVEIMFFTFDEPDGAIGDYLGSPFYATNVEAGYYIELWDGSVNGQKLEPGTYVIVVYAEYLGVASYKAVLFDIE